MKAVLEFNLPEETEEYETYMNAGKMASFIHEMLHGQLRNVTKYHSFSVLESEVDVSKLSEKEIELVVNVVAAIRTYIGQQLIENDLNNL